MIGGRLAGKHCQLAEMRAAGAAATPEEADLAPGRPVTDGQQRETAIGQGLTRIKAMVPVLYKDVDPRLHPAAAHSVLAHTLHLVREGREQMIDHLFAEQRAVPASLPVGKHGPIAWISGLKQLLHAALRNDLLAKDS